MTHRTYVRLRLDLDTWRIGAWESAAASVRGTARDPQHSDRPYVPGTSVLGSLRASLEEPAAADMFGSLASGPSTWWVLGTSVTGAGADDAVEVTTRRQTTISRRRRAPSGQGLSASEEVLACGLTVYLRAEHPDAETARAGVSALVTAIGGWRARIGGGRTRGLGEATVTELVHRTLDLTRLDDVVALATSGSGSARVDTLLAEHATSETITCDAGEDLVSLDLHAAEVGLLADTHDRATHGSQWKGMLRARVELIARSLGHPACITDESWTGCGRDGCGLCDAFGSTRRSGALVFHTSAWEGGQERHRQRNAVDRFTSGVRDGALFSERTVEDVRLHLRISEVSKSRPVAEWVHLALLHALRDLDDGLWGIGPRTAIGLGTVTIEQGFFRDLERLSTDEQLTGLRPVTIPAQEVSA